MQVASPRRAALLGACVVALAVPGAARAAEPDARPVPFGAFEGLPPEWTDVLNGYVYDPATYGPRLIAIERGAGGELPPVFRMAAADAQLRAGNRRGAERIFEQSLAAGAGHPWDDFANLAMGTIRLASGDEAGAETFFGRLVDAEDASSRALGNLGLGAALAASGRFAEAQQAFEETAEADDPEVQQAGKLGSALALHGAGDHAGAAQAFDELAIEDPDGPSGQDARYAAARARIAMGQRDESAAALRELVRTCDERGTGGRAPRALRRLDPRAMGRDWLRNYRRTAWGDLHAQGKSMFSIGGCALARSTLHALERDDARLTAIQPVVAAAPGRAASVPSAGASRELPSSADAPVRTGSDGSWGSSLVALLAIATVVVFWRVVGRGARAS